MRSEILTTSEAANLLKVSGATLRRWIRRGKLPAFQIGRKYRIRRRDIEKRFELRRETYE